MEDKKIKEKITFFQLIFMLFEALLIYSLLKNYIELAVGVLSLIVVLLITLFMELWKELNKER